MNDEENNILNSSEAEQYHIKALFILNELQANKKVYGSNSTLSGAIPADVDLAIQYINRSLEISPENAAYLNLKALLIWEGKGDRLAARPLLERAAKINPRDIDIQNNLQAIKTTQCIVATAAFGTPIASEVVHLRRWRDNVLSKTPAGRLFISLYYLISPPIAKYVEKNNRARVISRFIIKRIIKIIQ